MKVVWSPLALQKLGDTAEFISLDSPSAAENWVNEIFDKAELLGTMPEMGRFVPEMPNTNYREIIFGHYRIIYSLGLEVRILTVRNCRQLLSEDDL
ncbi:type II toxin-antitoxin system RelE/ParE family toxin [Vibrio sp. HN007]|uniref:type II toxin-antitoxin system RelE/ParE family toxin n=1 Tax=Vibrio iocasae TaxID=3098914 RepID=UPI0035D42181